MRVVTLRADAMFLSPRAGVPAMPSAILYRWKLKPGRDAQFREAWAEGTRRIHRTCQSYGAALNQGEDGIYWSYAVWPDDTVRRACFKDNDWFSQDCFRTMQDCIAERFEEICLSLTNDELQPRADRHEVPVLTTDRLLLRPLQLDDAAALLPALSDPQGMRYWSRPPIDDIEEVRDYIGWNIAGSGVQTWALARPDAPDDALGWVVLIDDKPGVAELGYILRPDAHGQGLGREAAARIVSYGLKTRGLRRIFADTDPDNTGSIRLLENLGFRQEGRLKAAWDTHIGVRDSLIFAIVREEDRGEAKEAGPRT